MRSARFQIAGLVFEINAAAGSPEFEIPRDYLSFVSTAPEVDFTLTCQSGIPAWTGELVFDSQGPWKLWRSGKRSLITLHSSTRGESPYQIAYVDGDFKTGATFVDSEMEASIPGYFPFTYPLDEVLAINRLALGHGIEVHACGVNDRGRGILFLGVSGAGKSTMSRQWDSLQEVTVLSDDRIIITPREGRFWIHGTPWHGDAGLADPGGVPLADIFFISHGQENAAAGMGPAQTASRLLARSFPTYWSQEGMGFSAGLATDIALAVPGRTLAFVPGPEAVDYVRRLLES